jgi:hypothetical protein
VVNAPIFFYPKRLPGQIFNTGASVLLIGAGTFGFWQASQEQVSPIFLLYLLPALLAIILVPVFLYRLQALNRASYGIERDGIRLKWGLRVEDIPMDRIMWIQMSSQFKGKLPLPWHSWPGAVLGKRLLADMTPIEYLSASRRQMVLIGAANQIYAISPEKPAEFLQTFTRLAELGSLASIPPQSQRPSFLLKRLWDDAPARALVIAGFVLTLLLFAGVALAIPTRGLILLRPGHFESMNTYVPSIMLLLLPVLSSSFFAVNFLSGLFFFRQIEWEINDANVKRVLSYVLFSSGAGTPLLFLIAFFHILWNN